MAMKLQLPMYHNTRFLTMKLGVVTFLEMQRNNWFATMLQSQIRHPASKFLEMKRNNWFVTMLQSHIRHRASKVVVILRRSDAMNMKCLQCIYLELSYFGLTLHGHDTLTG